MGGTTAKFAVIDRGEPLLAHGFEVDRRYRFKKGSGLPINLPVIEMIEIGAGGGSIARIDALGLLKVGPDSAGADPGPACYGRGGDRTDRHRRRSRARLPRPRLLPRRRDVARRRGGATGDPPRRGRAAGIERRGGRLGNPPDRQRGDGRRGAGAHPGARRRSAAAAGLRLRRRRSGAWLSRRGGARLAASDRSLRRGRDERDRLPGRADRLRFHPLLPRPPRRPRLGAGQRAPDRDGGGGRRSCSPPLGRRGRDVTHRRAAEMRYVGQGHEVRVPLPAGTARPGQCSGHARGVRDRVSPSLRPPRTTGGGGGDHLARRLRLDRDPISASSTAPEATGDAEVAARALAWRLPAGSRAA